MSMYESLFGKKRNISFTRKEEPGTRQSFVSKNPETLTKWTKRLDDGTQVLINKVLSIHGGEIHFNDEKRLYGAVVKDSYYCENESDVIVLIKDCPEGREVLNYSKQIIKRKELNFVKAFVCEMNIIDGLYANDVIVADDDLNESYLEEDRWIPEYRNKIFAQVVSKGGSDIHFELRSKLYIKARIDGFRRTIDSITYDKGIRFMRALHGTFSSDDFNEFNGYEEGKTFKIDIDGEMRNVRMRFDQAPAQVISDDRSSFDIVLRILGGTDSTKRIKTFKELGFDDESANYFNVFSRRKKGILLNLGPTGSGKTTTLHTFFYTYLENCLRTKKIISIEDPPEAIIDGVNIWPLFPKPNDEKSDTDARTQAAIQKMSSALRHDPDFIGVGEIRETVMAKMAYQASRTGHLVSSTLHASRWSDAYSRMINEFGLEPNEVAAHDSIQAIVVQNLVPKLCNNEGCFHTYDDVMANKSSHNFLFDKVDLFVKNWCKGDLAPKKLRFFNPNANKKCPKCGGTGVVGRILLYEMFVPEEHPDVIDLIQKSKVSEALLLWESKKSDQSKVHGYSIHDRAAEFALKGLICVQETIDTMGSNI